MVECDACDDDVLEVWSHRECGKSMTHRRIVWLCRACHPDVHEPVDRIGPDGAVPAD